MSKVWIALGSNMGEGRKNLDLAIKMMNERGVLVEKVSTYIETEPYGYTEQDNFVNAVCITETKLSPRELLEVLLKIELDMGRVRIIKWGPRIIDLDILFYEDLIIDEEDLKAPIALWETAEKLEEDEEEAEKFYQEQNVDILLSIEKFQQNALKNRSFLGSVAIWR